MLLYQIVSTGDSEGKEKDGYNKILMEEYIVVEKNKDIKSLKIEVYEKNDYYQRTRNIGTHFIDLENGKFASESKNEVVNTRYNDFWEDENI